MKTKSLYFCVVLMTVMAIVACDDSSSGAGPEPVAEVSSSSGSTRHCEEQTEGCDEAISSSSVTDKGTSSGGGSVSSSSVKFSSSTNAKSSSSSGLFPESCEEKDENRILTIYDTGERYVCKSGQYVKIESSSSSKVKKTCSADEEGTTRREDGVRFVCEDGYWVPVESSSSSKVSSSSYFDMTNQFNEKVSYGEFTDPRDGQKYRIVELKNGVFMDSYTIFAENLNYGKMILGGSVQGDSTKYCYDDDSWYCENGWGGLYTWSNAMGFPPICDSVSIASEKCPNKFNLENDNEEFNGKSYFVQHQGICPEGWHIMNENEWVEMSEMSHRDVAYYMGSKVSGFGNENLYGISILPAGYFDYFGKENCCFEDIAKQTDFWMPQQSGNDNVKAYMASVSKSDFSRNFPMTKKSGISIRCVKNY